jgi:hypothetical protein
MARCLVKADSMERPLTAFELRQTTKAILLDEAQSTFYVYFFEGTIPRGGRSGGIIRLSAGEALQRIYLADIISHILLGSDLDGLGVEGRSELLELTGKPLHMPQDGIQAYFWLNLMDGLQFNRVHGLFVLIKGPLGGSPHYLCWLPAFLYLNHHLVNFFGVVVRNFAVKFVVIRYLGTTVFRILFFMIFLVAACHLCIDLESIRNAR